MSRQRHSGIRAAQQGCWGHETDKMHNSVVHLCLDWLTCLLCKANMGAPESGHERAFGRADGTTCTLWLRRPVVGGCRRCGGPAFLIDAHHLQGLQGPLCAVPACRLSPQGWVPCAPLGARAASALYESQSLCHLGNACEPQGACRERAETQAASERLAREHGQAGEQRDHSRGMTSK